MKLAGILDIINSIAVFQLIFFSAYLFLRGKKIPSTLFLKIHLLFQLAGYISYLYWTREYDFIRPFLLLSIPSWFLWAPTFYLYICSRLYKNFVAEWKLMIHALPAITVMLLMSPLLSDGENVHDRIAWFGQITFYFSKSQILLYNLYTLYIIYRYEHDIKFITSADEKKKLNWLLFITYGLALNSLTDLILYCIPGFTNIGLGYIIFWIFLNLFFFKAILHPDQFLGIDEKKLLPVKLPEDKSKSHFSIIEEMINNKQLFLDPDLNLHNVAQAVRLSDRVVSQVIKQNTSLNFSDYINKKRIEYSKQVLSTTSRAEKNILEVLYEAGFNSKSVFNIQFKKHTGQSPTLFRENNRK
jgi:AraC-like DNA-binding protein